MDPEQRLSLHQVAMVAQTLDLEEPYFGAGGARCDTEELRSSYLATRLALLERGAAADRLQRDAVYLERRAQLLRSRFARRRPTRELLAAAERERQAQSSNKAQDEQLREKRYRVAEEYSFAGMGHIYDHHKQSVTRLVFANGVNSLLALVCVDGSVSVVSTVTGAMVHYFKRPSKKPVVATDVSWSLLNDWIMVAYSNGVAAIYKVDSGALLRYVKEAEPLVACAFHPQNSNVFLVACATAARLYNASTGMQTCTLQLGFNPAPITSAAFSGDWIFLGTSIGRVRSYQEEDRQQEYRFREEMQAPNRAPITSMQYRSWVYRKHQKRELLLSLRGSRRTLGLVQLTQEDGMVATNMWFDVPCVKSAVRSCFCPLAPSHRDGSCVVVGGDDACVRIYDLDRVGTKKTPVINTLQGHMAPVLAVAWSFDERFLASSDASGVVIVWKRILTPSSDGNG